ncbi:MAG: AmmeMemoRadiSam system radical SAM enzyme [Prolixibacteraceae bacterium]|jgi:pyruvate formate lyase activating enzyme|nr:AmmeMemoRadiSam system radical SAM enzyme [Prolixibacteraceae bacterium]
MNEALHYTKLENNQVQCKLCPRYCIIEEGRFGDCHARRNRHGVLSSEVYGKLSAMNTDPIEKKPLYHFFPGKEILSIGTMGCNLHCVFCQNHALSQCNNRKPVLKKNIHSDDLLDLIIKDQNNIGISFTYNEPTVNYEYVMEIARLVKMRSKFTVMVSNGYINPDPLALLTEYIDAFNIDLKGFNNSFYKKYSKATLAPVLESLLQIKKSGKHLEITNLVIPTINDDEDEFEAMCKWISRELGEDTILHLSRYFPRYELSQYPTPPEILFHLYDIAKNYLNHVYLGNMATELYSNTSCPKCKHTIIERTYFHIVKSGITDDGKCIKCGTSIIKYI